MELTKLIEKVEDLKEKHNSVTRALSKLNEFYNKGEITEKQFKILKGDYEKEINFLSKELDELLNSVREQTEEFGNQLKNLNMDYNKIKINILIGEIPPDKGKAELAQIAKQMALTQHSYDQYKSIIEAQTEEDFEVIKKMSPPASVKVENVTPVQDLLHQEEELRNKRFNGKAELYLKPLEGLYNRLEKIKDFLTVSITELESQKNALEEEAGKLVIKIRMGGSEEQSARNNLMEVIKKVKDYDELLAKISKIIDEINSRLGVKESVLIGAQEDASKIGQIEEINLEEASRILEELEKQGLEVINTDTTEIIKSEKEEEELVGEEKQITEPSAPKIIKASERKKRSPVAPILVISLLIVIGVLFAVYRNFYFVPEQRAQVIFPCYMGNPAHNYNVKALIIPQPPRIEWSRKIGGSPVQPAINKGIIYIGTQAGTLYAIDSSGNALWSVPLNGSILHTPVIVDDKIIVGTLDGFLYILNTSGQIILTESLGGGIASPPIAYGEIIYIPVFQEGIYAYNINQDRIEWKFATEGMVKNIPVIDESNLYIADLSGKIYILNRSDGMEVASFKTSGPIESYPVLYEGNIYYANSTGEIGCYDTRKRTLLWSFNLMEPVSGSPAIQDSFVIYTTAFGRIFCHNYRSGIRLWDFNTQNLIFSTPVIIDSFVFITTTTSVGDFGELYCLNLQNGSLNWVLPIPGVLETAPVFWDNRLFLVARDGTFYAMSF
ncbi:MAG TPA: PQQ-binding-like beta-propeller repeat protein [Candidatus Hydrothermia bacterium]|nr:PQQ-binding-like beta-propeller repeat protein [Candidatus Hydrothermae bacterium]MDD3648981.1 PQQ-binding-like beta-propeller repeat protein [Candidatus Hydrothermia bacterium]HOP31817.1 PQQ-binding-like beta-propeller repeat protein [Candidatus Hydrothermia bacterium]HRD22240.1 PQQ-binding-like beta-propeller repeat protein [Candidatus Hydrothermia bacterium]